MARLVIKKYSPLYSGLLFGMVGLLVLLALLFLLNIQYWHCIRWQLKKASEYQSFWGMHQRLESENKLLGEKLVRIERGHQIEKLAAIGLQSEVQALQDKLYKIQRELDFYQGVMEPARNARPLNIQGVLIESLEGQGHYQLKLILTHTTKGDTFLTGRLEIAITGIKDGKTVTLKTPTLFVGNVPDLKLHFKNFKQVSGRLMLPAGFKASKVVVRIRRKEKRDVIAEKVFDWLDITEKR